MLRYLFPLVSLLTVACGAQVVLEDDGTGGSGGATTSAGGSTKSTTGSMTTGGMTTGSMTTGTVGSGSSCDVLTQALADATAIATECNPFISSPQCAQIVNDTCGCPTVALNSTNPIAAQKREETYAAWEAAGCGPHPCFVCDPAEGGTSIPNQDGETGVCSALHTF